jgi:hypothetical protein
LALRYSVSRLIGRQHASSARRFQITRSLIITTIALLTAHGAMAGQPPPPLVDNAGRWKSSVSASDSISPDASSGKVGLYTPLQRNGADTTFIDAQAVSDNSGSFELNLGTGYRYELPSSWTLGSYGYLDQFGSGPADTHQQVTLGVEALRANWTLRTGVAVGLSGSAASRMSTERASN